MPIKDEKHEGVSADRGRAGRNEVVRPVFVRDGAEAEGGTVRLEVQGAGFVTGVDEHECAVFAVGCRRGAKRAGVAFDGGEDLLSATIQLAEVEEGSVGSGGGGRHRVEKRGIGIARGAAGVVKHEHVEGRVLSSDDYRCDL